MIGGKAAPGYPRAKLIINFINCIARKINNDSTASSKLKELFKPIINYAITKRSFKWRLKSNAPTASI